MPVAFQRLSSDLYTYMNTQTHTQVGTNERGEGTEREGERKRIYVFRIGSIIAKFPSSTE